MVTGHSDLDYHDDLGDKEEDAHGVLVRVCFAVLMVMMLVVSGSVTRKVME